MWTVLIIIQLQKCPVVLNLDLISALFIAFYDCPRRKIQRGSQHPCN